MYFLKVNTTVHGAGIGLSEFPQDQVYQTCSAKVLLRKGEKKMDNITVITIAFAAGMLTHRVLWSMFDWVLDKLEDMDEGH